MTVIVACALLSFPAGSAAAAPTLVVNAGAGERAISPYIYGMNYADSAVAAEIGLPVDRWGGNTTDTYNWKLGSSNTGSDYYFENVADCWNGSDGWCHAGLGPNTPAYQSFIAQDRTTNAATLLTLPLMGEVASNAPLNHPFTCGFPASVFATQDSFDPYDANCGSGTKTGTNLPSNPSRDGTPITPATNAAAWINDLKGRYATSAQGGVTFYELGNEPALWDQTHRDMHPQPTTYDELWQRSETTAAAVRATDPSAKVLAFSEWGWPNYFCSAADDIQNGCFATSPDRAKHGGTSLVEWLLQQAHSYDKANGGRLFDYLDLHYYRQGGETTDVTRSLWDPTYLDPSWINTPIDLIPRMQQWAANDDPGIGTSLSEYNLSIDSGQPGYEVTNALIQADTLGIFAREGLDLATRWALPTDGPLVGDAFLLYRNYDGKHSTFGDTYVRSGSSDQSSLAIYGAVRSSDGALTIAVINKSKSPLTSPLALSGFSPGAAAQTWLWTGGSITRQADQSTTASGFTATFPARSMTLFVIPPTASAPHGPTGATGSSGPGPTPAGTTPTTATPPTPKPPKRMRKRKAGSFLVKGNHAKIGHRRLLLNAAVTCAGGGRSCILSITLNGMGPVSSTIRPGATKHHLAIKLTKAELKRLAKSRKVTARLTLTRVGAEPARQMLTERL